MRIRTIKPEFFLHEKLFEMESSSSLPVRLAFIGLWCIADREGRFKWEPRKLGVQVLPYDPVDFSHILNALEAGGMIHRYGEAGEFGVIPSFLSHQCINIREAKSSLPEPALPARACTETVQHIPRGVNMPGPLRRKIMERDGDKCVRCSDADDLTIDHIFPQCIGGTHAETNLRTLCRRCNSARPVAGQALLDDLARDGFTMNDKQRMCTHAQARGEGKGTEGNKEQGKERVSPPPASDAGAPARIQLPEGVTTEMEEAWNEWQDYRLERSKAKGTQKLAWTERAAKITAKQISDYIESHGQWIIIDRINSAISGNWQGLNLEKLEAPKKTASHASAPLFPTSRNGSLFS